MTRFRSVKRESGFEAFISYRHGQLETEHAQDLERQIKVYAKPPFGTPRKVFRDEKHLAAGGSLGKAIRDALEVSQYLIFIASKDSADSQWVQDELRYWCGTLGRAELLIIVWVQDRIETLASDASIASPLDRETIDWGNSDALPKVLEPHIHAMPFYVDLRWARTRAQRSLEDAKYKAIVNSIVARLLGKDPNDLLGEEVRAHRAQIRLRNAAIATILMLLVASLVATGLAWRNLLKSRVAEAQAYLGQAQSASKAGRSDIASLYGAAALSLDSRNLGNRIFGMELHPLPKREAVSNSLGGTITTLSYLEDGRHLVAFTAEGGVRFLKVGDSGEKGSAELGVLSNQGPSGASALGLSPEGNRLVLGFKQGEVGTLVTYAIRITSEPSLHELQSVSLPDTPIRIAISKEGRYVAVTGEQPSVEGRPKPADLWLVELPSGEVHHFELKGNTRPNLTAFEFARSKQSLVMGSQWGVVYKWDIPSEPQALATSDPFSRKVELFNEIGSMSAPMISGVATSRSSDDVFATASISGQLGKVSWSEGPMLAAMGLTPSLYAVTTTPDGQHVIAVGKHLPPELEDRRKSGSGLLAFFHTGFDGQLQKYLFYPDEELTAVAVSPDSRHVATGTDHGHVVLWRLPNHGALVGKQAMLRGVAEVSVDATDSRALLLDNENELTVIRIAHAPKEYGRLSQVLSAQFHVQSGRIVILRRIPEGLAVEAWRLEPWRLVDRWTTPSNAVGPAALLSDGSRIAIEILGKTVLVVDRSGNSHRIALKVDEGLRHMALGPDGRRVAICTDQRMLLADIDPKAPVAQALESRVVRKSGTEQARFTRTGRFLVGHDASSIWVMDLTRPKLHPQEIPITSVEHISFAENDRYLLVASRPLETSLSVYDLEDLSNRAERIDLGVRPGKVVSVAFSEMRALIGITPDTSTEHEIHFYDLQSLMNSLRATKEDGTRGLRTCAHRYGYSLVNGVAVR